MKFHVLSFEGPDAYARVGGLAARVGGFTRSLAARGFETHLWFLGGPDLPSEERCDGVRLHRWAQGLSRRHPRGVYDGELAKAAGLATSLPEHLVNAELLPALRAGERSVVLAEEWQTVETILRLHERLERDGLRDRVTLLWNANQSFGFEGIPWRELQRAAVLTTVSRYMKHRMWERGVDPLVVPQGLPEEAFARPERRELKALRERFPGRTLLAKVDPFQPSQRWRASLGIVSRLRESGARPLLLMHGEGEPFGSELLELAQRLGLRRVDRSWRGAGARGLLAALEGVGDAELVRLRTPLDAGARRWLLGGVDAVLAQGAHQPFGLVGLETMAVGGVACTGCSGEDYAVAGYNALVLESKDPREFLGFFRRLRAGHRERAMRRAARRTARRFAWNAIVQRILLPRLALLGGGG